MPVTPITIHLRAGQERDWREPVEGLIYETLKIEDNFQQNGQVGTEGILSRILNRGKRVEEVKPPLRKALERRWEPILDGYYSLLDMYGIAVEEEQEVGFLGGILVNETRAHFKTS